MYSICRLLCFHASVQFIANQLNSEVLETASLLQLNLTKQPKVLKNCDLFITTAI